MSGPGKMARPEGFEPPTPCFGGTCSIHLSYGRAVVASVRVSKTGSVSVKTVDISTGSILSLIGPQSHKLSHKPRAAMKKVSPSRGP